MAFEGDLSNLSLGDVLQTIFGSRQNGTFIIRGAEERRLACGAQGIALISTRASLGLQIGRVLVGTGKITEDALEQALKTQRRHRDKMLGHILEEEGACTAEDVRGARRYIAAEEIFELFLWREGTFEFVAGEPECMGLFSDLWFDVPSMAMEAARRIDEMPRALEAAPPGEVFIRTPWAEEHAGEIAERRDLVSLLALIDGARTVQDVFECYYRGRFDTWKGMESLLEQGFLRRATPAEVLADARSAAAAKDHLRAARLFRRAAEHAPGDEAIARSVADSLRDAGDKRGAAGQLAQIGAERLDAGDVESAVKTFRQALFLDAEHVAAHEGLLRALTDAGRMDEAATEALAAARLRSETKDYAGAAQVVESALVGRPEDPALLVSYAAALHGLGRKDDAVKALDEAARIVSEADAKDARLLDIFSRIVQIDPKRDDCARRLQELQEGGAERRKRLRQRFAVAAGALVLATAAVPVLRGPSVDSRIEKARALLDATRGDAKKAEEAQVVLAALEGRTLTDDQAIERDGLLARVEQTLHPPDSSAIKRRVEAALDDAFRTEATAFQEGRVADGLSAVLAGLDVLGAQDGRRLQNMDSAGAKKFNEKVFQEADLAFGLAAAAAQKTAARVASVRDRYDANFWKKEDLDVLHDVIAQSAQIVEMTKGDSWTKLPDVVRTLVKRTRAPKDKSDKKIIEASAVVVDGAQRVAENYGRALVRCRRKELKEGYVATYADGAELRREGKLEDALQRYDAFLTRCEELRSAVPPDLYAPVVRELLGGEMMLDQRIRGERERVTTIVRAEAEADKAEAADDFETAFRVCKRLAHDCPDVDFSHRFQMPLRIETAPPGVEVLVLDGTSGGRSIGRTPLATRYPVVGGAKFRLRLAGYKEHDVVRKGAAEDVSGIERVEMPKLPAWTSKPAGAAECAPAEAEDAVVVAGRDGVVRKLDAKTGAELARFAPGLLDGFAAGAVVRGERVFVAALDAKGFVLKLDDLSLVTAFETGAVRGTPLSTPRGVLVADESTGTVRLVGDDGRAAWTKQVGKVRTEPAAAGDRAVLVTTDGEVVLIDPASGEVVRRRQLRTDSTWGAPTVRNGRVFLGDASGDLVCLDAATLADAWTRVLDGPVRGRTCATDLRVVACTGRGVVHVFDAENGTELSKAVVGDKPDDAACGACGLPDGGFVVATKKGVASRFDAAGRLVWRFEAGEDLASPPRLLCGEVVVVTKKGVVVGLDP